MEAEVKICQNCKQSFRIEEADFKFYGKIKVPPPTWCPECRLVRRLAALNHNSLYHRQCNLCGKNIIAMYHSNVSFPVYCMPCVWSDRWNPLWYGREYNFVASFFQQFQVLQNVVPRGALMGVYQTWINSEYNNFAQDLKNCYLLFNSDYNENCAYGSEVERSKDCFDIMMVDSCELSYFSVDIVKSYATHFSIDCEGCQNVWFSKNLTNCSNCFGCINLRNKQYYIFNKAYTKEIYLEELKNFDLGSAKVIGEMLKTASLFYLKFPHKFIHGRHNVNVSGDYIYHSKNTHDSYIATESENCRYCMWLLIKTTKECYDYSQFGENAQNVYEALVCGKGINNLKFSAFCVADVFDVDYCIDCDASHHLFACIGLRNKSYCILNKQYTKEEYEKLVPRIIEHMNSMPYVDSKGRVYRYGEFFPPELSPFSYNETIAQEYFPLSKDEALAKGYSWKDPEPRNYEITLKTEAIPDHITGVTDSILNEIIQCAHYYDIRVNPRFDQRESASTCNEQCTTAFRIITSPASRTPYSTKSSNVPTTMISALIRVLISVNPLLRVMNNAPPPSGSSPRNLSSTGR